MSWYIGKIIFKDEKYFEIKTLNIDNIKLSIDNSKSCELTSEIFITGNLLIAYFKKYVYLIKIFLKNKKILKFEIEKFKDHPDNNFKQFQCKNCKNKYSRNDIKNMWDNLKIICPKCNSELNEKTCKF